MRKKPWLNHKEPLKARMTFRSARLEKIQKHIPKSLYQSINTRLCHINQLSYFENLQTSILLSIGLWIVGIIYFLIAYTLFHVLWYHVVFSIGSSFIFMYLCREYYFEYLEKRLNRDLPKCCKKLSHYYTHYKGNVIPALKDVEEKGPQTTKIYMVKIRKVLESLNTEEKMDDLKANMPHAWLKMLCTLILFAKSSGEEYEAAADSREGSPKEQKRVNAIGRNMRRLTSILSFLNIEQGFNDADLFSIELFVFFAPFFFIPLSEWFNAKILMEMNMMDIYQTIEAQTMKAAMFFLGNISALFIHWMRKQQN